MQTLKSMSSIFSTSHSNNLPLNPTKPFLLKLFFSCSSLSKTFKDPNRTLVNYLVKTFGFSETKALSVSARYSHVKSLEKPQSLFYFLHKLGFSNTHVRSAVNRSPQILFADIDRTLKPKIEFFQDLGLAGSELGYFLSKNVMLLNVSLEKKLVPCVEILRKILLSNEDLVKVLRRGSWILCRDPESTLLPNIAFLESCGIVGSQLSMLLRWQPRLFAMQAPALRDFVSRLLSKGFSMNSRLLISVSWLSDETIERKFEIVKSFGFSNRECLEIFTKEQNLLRTSDKKLKLGIDFFLNTIKVEKEVLVQRPAILVYSMEKRVIPRYKVLEIVKSKRLLKNEPSFKNVMTLTEAKFLEKFIWKFRDDAQELLEVYRGCNFDSSYAIEKT